MNEIDKLKTEHARYKKALVRIQHEYNDESDACVWASAALNPTPTPPVRLEQLLAALKNLNAVKEGSVLHSVRFFSDESGHIYAEKDVCIASFYSLQQALDILNEWAI